MGLQRRERTRGREEREIRKPKRKKKGGETQQCNNDNRPGLKLSALSCPKKVRPVEWSMKTKMVGMTKRV
jgi:hypothetical protein